jgi:hypothetical protein
MHVNCVPKGRRVLDRSLGLGLGLFASEDMFSNIFKGKHSGGLKMKDECSDNSRNNCTVGVVINCLLTSVSSTLTKESFSQPFLN